MIRIALESRDSDELRRMLGRVRNDRRGKILFKYRKLDGTMRRAKAEYSQYVPRGKVRRPADMITYYDGDRRDFRSFHDWQLVSRPKYIK